MKTIEEIRAAVMAYCEETASNWSVGIQVDIDNLPDAYVSRRWTNGVFDAHFSELTIAIDSDTKDSEFALLYRLLGLSERDAVEDTKAFYESLFAELKQSDLQLVEIYAQAEVGRLQAEKRNAALVAALEYLKQKFGFNTFLNPEFTGGGSHRHINSIGLEISRILQSNKEGVSNEN